MKVVVDNFAILGIESCLLERLSDMLSSEVVMGLDDEVVQEIAAEQPDSYKDVACIRSPMSSSSGRYPWNQYRT